MILHYLDNFLSENPKGSRKSGAGRKLSRKVSNKNVDKFDGFGRSLPCAKVVNKMSKDVMILFGDF